MFASLYQTEPKHNSERLQTKQKFVDKFAVLELINGCCYGVRAPI